MGSLYGVLDGAATVWFWPGSITASRPERSELLGCVSYWGSDGIEKVIFGVVVPTGGQSCTVSTGTQLPSSGLSANPKLPLSTCSSPGLADDPTGSVWEFGKHHSEEQVGRTE